MKAMNLLGKSTLMFTLLVGLLSTAAMAAGLDELPANIRQELYSKNMIDPMQPIEPSAYRDWKAKEGPPWTIGYASSYAGNTWRAAVMQDLQKNIIPKWKKLGLLKKVLITQSHLKTATQIQQIRQLVDEGVDAILVCCSNPTALNQSIKYAHDHGVPVFSFTGYLTSPYAVNSSTNYQLGGYEVGKWMGKFIGGKGNVVVVEGIEGTSGSDSQDRGMKAGLHEYPGIKIVGDIEGKWTDQVGQAALQRWLATHPGKLDGVVVQSAAELGVLRALLRSGRKMVPVSIGGELGALCYWRKHPKYIDAAYQLWPPADDFNLIWRIMMRTLEGQGPKIESILVPPKKFTFADVKERLADNCSMNSQGWAEVGQKNWGSVSYLNQFFLHPADPTKYKP